MANIFPQIQKSPSFSSRLGASLGQGLGQGFSDAVNTNQKQKFYNQLMDSSNQNQSQDVDHNRLKDTFLTALPQIEQQMGRELEVEELDQLWDTLSKQEPIQKRKANPQSEIENLSNKSLLATASGERDIGAALADKAKLSQKALDTKTKAHGDIANIALKSAAEKAEALPQKESALDNMIDAIQNGDLSFFSGDNLADLTGLEAFRSPEGALFKTTGKEFFLGSLKRAGARPNQWVEKQILDMLPKMGRSMEANLVVTEALKTELAIEKKQIELTNQISDEMEAEYGYVRRNLADEVRKKLTPYANEKQKELQDRIIDIKDMYNPTNKEGSLMYDPSGNLRRVESENIKSAKKAGYRMQK